MSPTYIVTDKNRLSQILVNLLGNAFKFTFHGGVTVRVESENTDPCKVKFFVQDTGIGIKREDIGKLFKMYGKLEQQDNKINTNGIGLGLTISNSLAMLLNPQNNKTIEVESRVGEGTCFSFVVLSQPEVKPNSQGNEKTSLADISSIILNEDKSTNVGKKMSTYANRGPMHLLKVVAASRQIKVEGSPLRLDQISFRDEPEQSHVEEDDQNIGKVMKALKRESNRILMRESNYIQRNKSKYGNIKMNEIPWSFIVDDNPFNLMVACHIMEERGYRVKTALNGQEAIQKAKEHQESGEKFKVVLMDCQMPVMDGYEATRLLKEMMKTGEISACPIVALTANNRNEEHETLCRNAGMDGHIAKPLQIDELERVLKEVQIDLKL